MEATDPNIFRPFDQWLLSKLKGDENITFPIADRDDFKKVILTFQKEYFKNHGSSEKVRRFIINYFTEDDKQKLINGFKIQDNNINYNSLDNDEQLKIIIDMLYNERNAFVHQGRLPQINDFTDSIIGYVKIKNRDTYISIEISINEIQKMFERAFIKFLKKD